MSLRFPDAIRTLTSSVSRLSGISDIKTAVDDFRNHQWTAGANHALKGVTRAAFVIGTLYVANQMLINTCFYQNASPFQGENQVSCEDLLAQGFNGTAACSGNSLDPISVPALNSFQYKLVSSNDDDTIYHRSHCVAVLTEAGQKLIPLTPGCTKVTEIWKFFNDNITLWWDYSAKLWY